MGSCQPRGLGQNAALAGSSMFYLKVPEASLVLVFPGSTVKGKKRGDAHTFL